MNNMHWDCHQVFINLSNYLDNMLSAEEKTAFQEHVANCNTCSQFGDEFFSIIQELKKFPIFKSKQREQKVIKLILEQKS